MNSIAVIGLRLISIYLIVTGINAIVGLSAALTVMEQELNNSIPYLQLLSVVIPFISGVIIWLISVPISKHIVNIPKPDTIAINDTNLVSAGTFLIGLYLVFSTIPTLYVVLIAYKELEYGMESSSVIRAIRLNSIVLVLGIFLMVGHRFFVRAYTWLRSTG